MAKKNKKTKRELLQEIREEGMFKEAMEFSKKKKYVAASDKDNVGIYIFMLIAVLAFVFINRIFGV